MTPETKSSTWVSQNCRFATDIRSLAEEAQELLDQERDYQIQKHGRVRPSLKLDQEMLFDAERSGGAAVLMTLIENYRSLGDRERLRLPTSAEAWVLGTCKFAVFQAPSKGDRIELPTKPGEYFLVVDRPEVGQDASGQKFWHARVRGKEGNEQLLSSDQVATWKHHKGQPYPWHEQEAEKQHWQQEQRANKEKIAAFEQKYVFRDGTPLRATPGKKILLHVSANKTPSLEVFAGERLMLNSIDYDNETVSLRPVVAELEDLSSSLTAVPAGDLVQAATPAANEAAMSEQVTLPSGEKISAAEMMERTPALNSLAKMGQISIVARVEPGYRSRGMNGEEQFVREMQLRNVDDVKGFTQYYLSPREVKLDPSGRPTVLAAWSGDIRISPPISDAVMREIKGIAPENKIWQRRDGAIRIQSNALYKQMVSLGVQGSPPSETRRRQPS